MSSGSEHDHLVWHEIDRRRLLDAHVFTVFASRRRADDGTEATFSLCESADWCNIVAETERGDGKKCFVMARQFRHGSAEVTIEFPGGLVDPGEKAVDAVLRELTEETGYTAESATLIGQVNPNPALMNNTVHTFVAHGVRPASEQQLDQHERLDAELVPVAEVLDLVRPDFHHHALMMAALHWYRLYLADGLDYSQRLERWEHHSQESRRV